MKSIYKKIIRYKTKHSRFGNFNRLIHHHEKDLHKSLIMIDSTSKLDDWTRTFHETLQSKSLEKNFKKKKNGLQSGRFIVY